ncbi:hypothetical protein [Ornithinibacillus scapharcae]|uniref:hypothetical protein n=1 Tax=Ornithinibacillus scapharcae TaxID=1147159 RepID=UPI000225B596|nr:hypothetical protein [Ornithinibacillus scapharcae]
MFNWFRKRIQENQKQFKNNKNWGDGGAFISGTASTGLNDDDEKHSNDDFSSGSSFDSGGSDGGGNCLFQN